MAAHPTTTRRSRESLWLAWLSCWALGAGLLLWALVPFILAAISARFSVRWDTLVASAAPLLAGAAYLVLGQLIRRRFNWALRVALCLSVLLLAAVLGLLLLSGARSIPLFPTLLALCVTVSCWMALATQDAAGSQL
jgi:hypothetical protein